MTNPQDYDDTDAYCVMKARVQQVIETTTRNWKEQDIAAQQPDELTAKKPQRSRGNRFIYPHHKAIYLMARMVS